MAARIDVVHADYHQKRMALLTPEQRRQWESLCEEEQESLEEAEQAFEAAKQHAREVGAEHLELKKPVKGQRYRIELRRGRIEWNDEELVAWFKGHDLEAMNRFRKEKPPTVAIAQVRAKGE
jgi:hypothetical protein